MGDTDIDKYGCCPYNSIEVMLCHPIANMMLKNVEIVCILVSIMSKSGQIISPPSLTGTAHFHEGSAGKLGISAPTGRKFKERSSPIDGELL